jgi:hypothetical protein
METNHNYRSRYSAQTRANHQQQAKKSCATSKSGKKRGIFKVMVIVIVLGLLAKAMFSSVPVKKTSHVIVPGDTISAILDNIAAQVEEENNLTRLNASMFAQLELFDEGFIIYPGDILEIEVRVTPLGVITKTGTINYYLIERATR